MVAWSANLDLHAGHDGEKVVNSDWVKAVARPHVDKAREMLSSACDADGS